MSFPSLSTRIDGLNLILAGPILRRVTQDDVSVWLAMKAAVGVKLEIYLNTTKLFESPTVDPVSIGPKLAIVCVTAKRGSAAPLSSGIVYEYDLKIGAAGVSIVDLCGDEVTFSTVGAPSRPSFVLPAATRSDLIVCTGSCRKPHGPGKDALAILHRRIEDHLDDPSQRPQLLLLSGDQIYADDVAGALLHMLLDAEEALIGSDEVLPDWGRIRELKPTSRGSVGNPEFVDGPRFGFFTSGHSDSHLLSLSEYILMYIFAWSPVLWATQEGDAVFPEFTEVTGKSDVTKDWVNGRPVELETAAAEQYRREVKRVGEFYDALGDVRRVLANVPSLMMFDDHEVTDDWYLSGWWCDRALKSPAARRVMSNGLTAFALCQAWGNTPIRFESGQWGGDLLTALGTGPSSVNRAALESKLLPPTGQIFLSDGTLTLNSPIPVADRWCFDIVYPAFHLVVMDTRTARGFPGVSLASAWNGLGFPQVIATAGIASQVPSLQRDLAIVLLPPPLLGSPTIEWVQSGSTGAERYESDCEAPALDTDFVQGLLAAISSTAPLIGGQRKLTVVLLSGDVHFASGARIRYSSVRALGEPAPGTPTECVILQFTSSACKNTQEWWQRGAVRRIGTPLFGREFCLVFGHNDRSALDPLDSLIRQLIQSMEFREAMAISHIRGRRQPLDGGGYVLDVTDTTESERSVVPREWQYKVDYLRDVRTGSRYAVPDNNVGVLQFTSNAARFEIVSYLRFGFGLHTLSTILEGPLVLEDL